MTNWTTAYNHFGLFRLAAIALIFGVVWPGLCLVTIAGTRLARRIGRIPIREARLPWVRPS